MTREKKEEKKKQERKQTVYDFCSVTVVSRIRTVETAPKAVEQKLDV